MATRAELDAIIDGLLDNPRSVSSASGSVTNISIPDAIAADLHQSRKNTASNPFSALKRATAIGPRHYGT